MKKVNHRMFGNVMKYYVMAMTAVLIVCSFLESQIPPDRGTGMFGKYFSFSDCNL